MNDKTLWNLMESASAGKYLMRLALLEFIFNFSTAFMRIIEREKIANLYFIQWITYFIDLICELASVLFV